MSASFDLPMPTGQPELPGGIAHVLVEVSSRQVALPLTAMVEVVDLPELAMLPMAPGWLSGVSNLRGRIIPVVDLSRLLEWPMAAYSRRALVLRDGSFRLALPVETVHSVRWLDIEDVASAPSALVRQELEIDGRSAWVINSEAVLARVRRGESAVMAGR